VIVNPNEPQEFALWLQRANDPSVSEEERRESRVLMDHYLLERMREAFRLAGATANVPGKNPGNT
jgi:hypothetical protein